MTFPDTKALIEELRADAHREPVDPKAVYRTRRVGLFEEAASELSRLLGEGEQLTGDVEAMARHANALSAKRQAAEAQLEGLREALAEMVDYERFFIVKGAPDPMFSVGWADACKFFGEKANTALAAAQTGVKPEGRNHPNPPVPS